jgi:hypothetical protein
MEKHHNGVLMYLIKQLNTNEDFSILQFWTLGPTSLEKLVRPHYVVTNIIYTNLT